MAAFTQANVAVLAPTVVPLSAAGLMVASTPISVATYLSGVVYIRKGKTETTADLTAGLDFIELQSSPDASGNNWATVQRFIPTGGTALTASLTTNTPAGQVEFLASTTAAFLPGDKVFVTDNTDAATNGEFHMVSMVHTNVHVTLVDPLLFDKNTTVPDKIFGLADWWAVGMDFSGIQRLRLLIAHTGATGAGWVVRADLEAATALA